MLKIPVKKIAITQNYHSKHPGVDFGWVDKDNLNIYCTDKGTILFEGYLTKEEIVIAVHHKETKTLTLYGHLAKTLINKNDKVVQGQNIAVMGNTGTTYVHLHHEVWKNVPDDIVFSLTTLNANRRKYAVDPLSIEYCYDDQVVLEGSKKYITKYVKGTNVPINDKVDQLEVIIDDLNARDNANGKVIGYVKKGVYNVLGISKTLLYTWYQVETNLWLAYNQNWVILMPRQENELERLIRENAELKKEIVELDKEIVTLKKENSDLSTQNDILATECRKQTEIIEEVNKLTTTK